MGWVGEVCKVIFMSNPSKVEVEVELHLLSCGQIFLGPKNKHKDLQAFELSCSAQGKLSQPV